MRQEVDQSGDAERWPASVMSLLAVPESRFLNPLTKRGRHSPESEGVKQERGIEEADKLPLVEVGGLHSCQEMIQIVTLR